MKKLMSLILVLGLISFVYGLELTKANQALTANWADIGDPIQTGSYGIMHMLFTVDINDSEDVQFRFITKLGLTHVTDYERCIFTASTDVVTTKPEIYKVGDNVDKNYHWSLVLDDRTPYVQIQVKVGTVNATAFVAWQAVHGYVLTDICEPTVVNGYYYVCDTAGNSGAAEPVWGTTVGGTTADGAVVWTCYQIAADINDLYVDMK